MAVKHVFVETNFLFGVLRLPSKRRRDALNLRAQFERAEIKLYLPYLCLQEAKQLIAKNLPGTRCDDLRDFHRYCMERGSVNWNFEEVDKLLTAATAEVNRTRAVYQNELAAFAAALGEGLLHATKDVFDFLESLNLDHDLEYNDRLILSTVLVKAGELHRQGEQELFFISTDARHLHPTDKTPRLAQYFRQAGMQVLSDFSLPA